METTERYFLAQNANRRIAGVLFNIVFIGAGTMLGVYATTDQALAEELLKVLGVRELTKDEYDAYVKKKPSQPVSSPPSQPPTPRLQVVLKVPDAVPVAAEPPKEKPAPKIEEAITVAAVEPPKPTTAPPPLSRRRTKAAALAESQQTKVE